ncbi:hypothetical protein FKW77_000173 [Venturia effusa]|uniref:Ubiquitin carboxyl-terminal hydrolase n=1 Tax=Venturia effusa TaxID=50376 RepID=A0A517LPI7_9PEZI|nr:hypothetical protein FKW77_000173 [Venturia effusa]
MSEGWNTIESDAGVFTYLLEGLGTKNVQFEELFALDTDYLKQLSPVYGVIFLFKWLSGTKVGEEPPDGQYDPEASENLFFAAQTIQNACGTQALLSVLLNQDDKVAIGDQLKDFKEFTAAFPSELRGDVLSNSELIRTVHNSFARSSPFIDETTHAASDDDEAFHFIAYTSINDTLYELDGLSPAPINHGPCAFSDFPDKVVPVIQRRMQRYPQTEIKFNLLAMIKDPRIQAKEIGDHEKLGFEKQRRTEWMWENALRRHNFVGFIGELTKGVVRSKLREGDKAYNAWVEEAKTKTTTRIEERRKKGHAGED